MSFFLGMSVFGLIANAQVQLKNLDLIDGAPNILYAGINNTIQIIGLDSANFKELSTSNGHVSRSSRNWDVFTVRIASVDTATLILQTKGFGKIRVGYSVRHIHDSTCVALGAITDTIATINEILSNPTLHVSLPETYLKEWFRVIDFSLDLTSSSGSIMARFEGSGPQLSKQQVDQIKLLQSGDELKFTRIIATCPECALRSLGPLNIHIK